MTKPLKVGTKVKLTEKLFNFPNWRGYKDKIGVVTSYTPNTLYPYRVNFEGEENLFFEREELEEVEDSDD